MGEAKVYGIDGQKIKGRSEAEMIEAFLRYLSWNEHDGAVLEWSAGSANLRVEVKGNRKDR